MHRNFSLIVSISFRFFNSLYRDIGRAKYFKIYVTGGLDVSVKRISSTCRSSVKCLGMSVILGIKILCILQHMLTSIVEEDNRPQYDG